MKTIDKIDLMIENTVLKEENDSLKRQIKSHKKIAEFYEREYFELKGKIKETKNKALTRNIHKFGDDVFNDPSLPF